MEIPSPPRDPPLFPRLKRDFWVIITNIISLEPLNGNLDIDFSEDYDRTATPSTKRSRYYEKSARRTTNTNISSLYWRPMRRITNTILYSHSHSSICLAFGSTIRIPLGRKLWPIGWQNNSEALHKAYNIYITGKLSRGALSSVNLSKLATTQNR